jgi:O-antigen ligase
LCLYGFYNYITKSNPYDDFITSQFQAQSFFEQYLQDIDTRFRINSFVFHPIVYGYLLSILFLLSLYCFSFIKNYKSLCLLAIPVIFLNLILANSRTPLFAFFIGLIVFISLAFKGLTKIRIMMFCIAICTIVYAIPIVNEKINNTIDIFKTGGNRVSGSSINMRMIQMQASYKEFLKNPVFGNGFYYISENLGLTADSDKRNSDSDLQGLESHVYTLLIEQGLIGMLSNTFFFFIIGRYFMKKIRYSKEEATLGLAILLMFLTYIIGTGSMGTWIITMGLIGIIVKHLELSSDSEPTVKRFP